MEETGILDANISLTMLVVGRMIWACELFDQAVEQCARQVKTQTSKVGATMVQEPEAYAKHVIILNPFRVSIQGIP